MDCLCNGMVSSVSTPFDIYIVFEEYSIVVSTYMIFFGICSGDVNN